MADLTNAERETHLNMVAENRNVWEVTTDDPVMVQRFKRIGATFVKKQGELHYFTLPANQVTLRNKRELTDEQRAVLRERAKVMQAARAVHP
jgi:predicted DNA-binding WGR domain protein